MRVAALFAAVLVGGGYAEHRVVFRAFSQKNEYLILLYERPFRNAHRFAERGGHNAFQLGYGQFLSAENEAYVDKIALAVDHCFVRGQPAFFERG